MIAFFGDQMHNLDLFKSIAEEKPALFAYTPFVATMDPLQNNWEVVTAFLLLPLTESSKKTHHAKQARKANVVKKFVEVKSVVPQVSGFLCNCNNLKSVKKTSSQKNLIIFSKGYSTLTDPSIKAVESDPAVSSPSEVSSMQNNWFIWIIYFVFSFLIIFYFIIFLILIPVCFIVIYIICNSNNIDHLFNIVDFYPIIENLPDIIRPPKKQLEYFLINSVQILLNTLNDYIKNNQLDILIQIKNLACGENTLINNYNLFQFEITTNYATHCVIIMISHTPLCIIWSIMISYIKFKNTINTISNIINKFLLRLRRKWLNSKNYRKADTDDAKGLSLILYSSLPLFGTFAEDSLQDDKIPGLGNLPKDPKELNKLKSFEPAFSAKPKPQVNTGNFSSEFASSNKQETNSLFGGSVEGMQSKGTVHWNSILELARFNLSKKKDILNKESFSPSQSTSQERELPLKGYNFRDESYFDGGINDKSNVFSKNSIYDETFSESSGNEHLSFASEVGNAKDRQLSHLQIMNTSKSSSNLYIPAKTSKLKNNYIHEEGGHADSTKEMPALHLASMVNHDKAFQKQVGYTLKEKDKEGLSTGPLPGPGTGVSLNAMEAMDSRIPLQRGEPNTLCWENLEKDTKTKFLLKDYPDEFRKLKEENKEGIKIENKLFKLLPTKDPNNNYNEDLHRAKRVKLNNSNSKSIPDNEDDNWIYGE